MDFLFKKWSNIPINRKKNNGSTMYNNLGSYVALTDLMEEINNIDYYLKATKNTVVCDGDFNSPVMFIGEAPGEEENAQKIPFVGASGKLLNKMLEAIGMDRNKIYITNMFFWQPEQNRMPTPQELRMTIPYVEKHILIQKPKLIVTLGAVAAKSLLKINEGILSVRGTLQTLTLNGENFPVFIACHPSYVLRTHKVTEYLQDFQAIKKYLQKYHLFQQVQI